MANTLNKDVANIKISNEINQQNAISIIFAKSDLNAAAYYIAESLNKPTISTPFTTILVEAAAREEFIAKLKTKLISKYNDDKVTENLDYKHAQTSIEQLSVNIITTTKSVKGLCPTVVCDIPYNHFGDKRIAGIVTLQSFTTVKEAISLFTSEKLKFSTATIWNANHTAAFELVVNLNCSNFNINCDDVKSERLQKAVSANEDFIGIDGSYHFESLIIHSIRKAITYPIRRSFAN